MKQIKEIPTLDFGEAIQQAASRLFQFNGRSRRSEFWWTQLFVLLISILLTPFGGMLINLATIPLTFRRLHDTGRSGWWWGFKVILIIFAIILTISDIASWIDMIIQQDIPSFESISILSIMSKYVFLGVAVFLWEVILIILLCTDSIPQTNQYGPSPKYIETWTEEEPK